MIPNETKKCGEILVYIRNKINKVFLFNCAFCNTEYNNFDIFSLHIEEHLDISEDVFKDPINEFLVEPEKISMPVFRNVQDVYSEVVANIKKEAESKDGASANDIEEERPEILDFHGEQFLAKELIVLTDLKNGEEDTNAIGINEADPEDITKLPTFTKVVTVNNEVSTSLNNTSLLISDIKKEAESEEGQSAVGIEKERLEILDIKGEQFLAKEPFVLTDIKNAIGINEAEPDDITTLSTFTKVETVNNEVRTASLVIPDIKREAESGKETSVIGIKEENPEVPDNYDEQFVSPEIERETESYANTNDIEFVEENHEIVNYDNEQFLIKEINLDNENTEKTDCIEEVSNIITIDDSEDDNRSDSPEIYEIVIENASSDSENETLQQIEQILNNKRKTTTCINKETKKRKNQPRNTDYTMDSSNCVSKPFNNFEINGRYVRELVYCNMKCKSKITLDQQLYIFSQFWNIKSNEDKYNFIAKLILKKKIGDDNRYKYKYFLQLPHRTISVCRKCFMYTLCIKDSNIRTAIEKFVEERCRPA